jgi:hypothetical protein
MSHLRAHHTSTGPRSGNYSGNVREAGGRPDVCWGGTIAAVVVGRARGAALRGASPDGGMMERDDRGEQLREAAVRVALRTGLLKACPSHGDVYDPGQHDYQGARMVATYLVNQGDPLVAAFRGDRGPLTDLLTSICRGYATSCPRCGGSESG